jgi:hypothetical protein
MLEELSPALFKLGCAFTLLRLGFLVSSNEDGLSALTR